MWMQEDKLTPINKKKVADMGVSLPAEGPVHPDILNNTT